MRIYKPAREKWHSSQELKQQRSALSRMLGRLMILDYVWKELVGPKEKFWVLHAVEKDTLFVKVKLSVAKNELIGNRRRLISEINKHFTTPWIKHIEII